MSEKYYLLGEKLGHSYSSEIHKEFGYSYELKELEKEEIAGFLSKKELPATNNSVFRLQWSCECA